MSIDECLLISELTSRSVTRRNSDSSTDGPSGDVVVSPRCSNSVSQSGLTIWDRFRRDIAMEVVKLSAPVKWWVTSGRGVETTFTPREAHLSKDIAGDFGGKKQQIGRQ